MANSSETVNRLLRPPSRSVVSPPPIAADSTMSESGAPVDPFNFDDIQKHLSFIERSLDDPNFSMEAASIETLAPNPEHILEHLCRMMCSRGLAKHLESAFADVSKLSDVPELRERVRAALKLAPNPAELVYDCSRYVEDSQTYVLFMEVFLLMIGDGGVEIAASTEQAAQGRARRWRDIFHARGGFDKDCRIEARAFLFFLASFGFPADFGSEYIMNLIILSHPSQISETLRQSRVLVPMIPDIVEKMFQYKLYGEAIDVAYTFRIEDKFPPRPILTKFMGEFKEASMEMRKYTSLKELKNTTAELPKRYHALVESLRDHEVHVNDLIPGYVRLMSGLVKSMFTNFKEAVRDLKKDGEDAQKRKRERDEMETERPSFAHRLMIREAQKKRPRLAEPIICYLL